jgi:stearoyl-CoA desaturase (delta-9 desaturase)|tara:strand:- start:784 stop:1419 length:636 start_codon:yes stop_codon:yes gene_type:complete
MITTILLGILWYQVIAIFGHSMGLHRYFSHRQFKASKVFEVISLFLVTIAGARSPLVWVGAHRIHHVYADTPRDPHSPDHIGFWNVLLNRWNIENLWSVKHRVFIKDLVKNPRVMFFHKYWKHIYLGMAVICLLISLKFFIWFMVIPTIFSFFGYGIFNARGHKDKSPRTDLWINILSAGEGFHDVHHSNPKKIRLNTYDISGFIIEKFFK